MLDHELHNSGPLINRKDRGGAVEGRVAGGRERTPVPSFVSFNLVVMLTIRGLVGRLI